MDRRFEIRDGVMVARPRDRFELIMRAADGAETRAQSDHFDQLNDLRRQLIALGYVLVALRPLDFAEVGA